MTLASRSTAFKDILYSHPQGIFCFGQPIKGSRFKITDIQATVFHRILELLYNGAIETRGSLFPSACNPDKTEFEYFQKKGLAAIWSCDSDIFQLLDAADRFNLTKMLLHELRGLFLLVPCQSECCFRCITIYVLLAEGGAAPIHRTFDDSAKDKVFKAITEAYAYKNLETMMRSFAHANRE